MDLEIKSCTESMIGAWNDFVRTSSDGHTIAHNPSLGNILEQSYGYRSENSLIYSRGSLIGVFPSCRIGNKMVSMPHFSYGGVLGVTSEMSERMLTELIVKSEPRYEIRSFYRFGSFSGSDKITCFIELKSNPDLQMSFFKSKLRSQIRKGSKNGLEVRVGSLEKLDEFYGIYSKNMHRLGSPAQGKDFFRNLLKYYCYGSADVFCVYHEDRPIGASIVLSYLGFSEVCWAATLREYNYLQTNTFLYWEMIKKCVERGDRVFSFGRCTEDSPSHRFKMQWGTTARRLFYNYSNVRKLHVKKMRFLTDIWRAMPLSLVNKFGGFISGKIY